MASSADTRITWLRRAVLLALVAVAAWLCVRVVMLLVAPSHAWEPVQLASADVPAPTVGSRNYDFSTNPFAAGDEAETPEAAPAAPVTDAPETTLNLVLTARRVGDRATATIRTPNGEEAVYQIGEDILPDVVLEGVQKDFVLIAVNGQMQSLTFEDAKEAARNTGRRAQSTAPATQRLSRPPDFNTLYQQVDIDTATDPTGQKTGIRLVPRSNRVDLSDYGLRRTDVLTQVGNVPLTSAVLDINSLRRQGQNGRPVSVQILRDGMPMTITIGGPA